MSSRILQSVMLLNFALAIENLYQKRHFLMDRLLEVWTYDQESCRTGSVPCDREEWRRGPRSELPSAPAITSVFIRLAQGVVDAIWLDLGALNQG